MVWLTYRTIPLHLSSSPLLPRHRKVEQVLRLDEVVVAVGAEVDAHPLHGAAELVAARAVVFGHRLARVAPDIQRLIHREEQGVRALDASFTNLLAIDVERDGA